MDGVLRMVDTSVGERLRRARLSRGLKVRDLATRIGVSPATVSQLENDKAQLTVVRLEQVARELAIPAASILAGDLPASHPRAAGVPIGESTTRDWREYLPMPFDPIVDAALAEFLDVGYHGTTMRRISARSGVSVPGIYTHFASKQAILVRILDATMTDLEWRTRAVLAECEGPVDRFRCLVENLALYHTHRRELGFIGVSEVRALEPENRRSVAARRTAQQEVVDEVIAEGSRGGVFRVANERDAGRVVVSMCTALPTWWHPGGRLTPEGVASECVGFATRLVGAN
ncbi:TetR family transcriptional regulator [Gordonia hydrophobica]|uniref:TetR family transcriptional regulator n=1 Tax=Gordonia hydrophobica TaxID=40516 RepID=A0ABZ2U2K2_9ACTN|nr:TetR family transcriptional regulator [Gordonia hydrophobica]MBM7369007.1 AcrR family transcriptional regulator [Gordonia hydrophobica]